MHHPEASPVPVVPPAPRVAREPALWQVAVAGILSFQWLLLNKAPFAPVGLIVSVALVGVVTRASSLRQKLWLGRKYLLACFVLAAIGYFTGSPDLL